MTGDREYIVSGIRRLKGRTFKALLGKGDSGHTVAVAGKSNYVWVRVKYGSSLGAPVQALNRNVPPIHGRVVRVKEIDRAGIKGYEVIDFDDTGTPYYHDDTNQVVLPKHGWTHECSQDTEATDPVNLYTRCWAELRVEPTDPCSLYTYVTHGWYLFDTPTWFIGGNSPLFVPPAMGMRYDLVYIDSSGTIGIEQGDIGGFVATIPEPPDYTIPLAAIQFTGTAGCIQESMILDCRVMPNVKYPSGGAVFDDSITPSMIYPDLAPWPGTQDYPSRGDHKHGANCAVANVIVPDATAAEGVSTSFSRADHTHGIVCDIPGFIHAVDTLSLEGTGTSFARAGHIHGLNVGVPVAVGLANAEGGSTEFVRRDHVHQKAVCDVELIGTYLVGPDKTGNARGAQAIDIQTDRAAAAQVASGDYAVAIGRSNTASADLTLAIGSGTEATAYRAIAIGAGARATSYDSVSIGWSTYTFGTVAIAIGYTARGNANYGIAIGAAANAYTPDGIAIGHAAYADPVNYKIHIGDAAYNFKMTPAGVFSMMDWKVRRAPVARVVAATHTLSIDLNGSTYHVLLTNVAP